ncbi:MAG: hypothetical protein LUO88_00735 [Methanoregulaceae archaeon]|nr:hypothetical protein [Methanoregulaceae archaeon]
MRTSRILLIAGLLAIAMMVAGAAAAQFEPEKKPQGTVFKKVGNSGSLKIYPDGLQNPFILRKQEKITVRFDSNGTKVPGHSVNTAGGRWSPVEGSTGLDGNTTYNITYTKNFTVNQTPGTYSLLVQLLTNESAESAQMIISSKGNATDALGYAVTLDGWEFADGTHLNMTLDAESKGPSQNNRHKQRFVLSEGNPDLPVTLDGAMAAVDSIFTSKKSDLVLSFGFGPV